MTPLTSIGLGILLGITHALEADHVAAISTIATKATIKKAPLLGMWWGLGHTATLLMMGTIVTLLHIAIPKYVSHWFELAVGIMLILLGLHVIYRIKREKMHIHKHSHGNKEHIHIHSHKHTPTHSHTHTKAFGIGAVHGLAGTAGVMLLIAAATPIIESIMFILLFGLGTIAGMAAMSTIITIPFRLFKNTHHVVTAAAGVVSVGVGLGIII